MSLRSQQSESRASRANRLIDSTSPYLLQHAHNPVDWYPWGPEALNKARREYKPIFLSIGYAACHWCHVMERESFDNRSIADLLNRDFISIKVDREERPDLDEIYMSATMLYNHGQGGWPMSVFLTPEGKPFYAGTYFPIESRWGRPGFKDILAQIARLWQEQRNRLIESADTLTEAIRQYGRPAADAAGIPRELVGEAAQELARRFDPAEGGMLSGQTNKFPPSMAMSLMLREYYRTRRQGAPAKILLERVETTLRRMADGGIYDHLGGGIARYSTDPHWCVPHFEKMLYDQALVSRVYLEAYQVTGNHRYAQVARHIFDYVLADLQSLEGAFYCSRDADSEGVEGKYYVWSKSEIMDILGEPAGELFCSYYDVTEEGNWEGLNVLNVPRDLETVARLNGIDPATLRQSLHVSRHKILAARAQRVPPGLDDKVLTGWNGLMIGSLAAGARVLGEFKYAESAARAADFVLRQMVEGGRLLRTCRKGKAHTLAYLDDYAFFIEGLLELYSSTFEPRRLLEAIHLNEQMIARFWDPQGKTFFFTADDAEKLVVRTKDIHDGATPAGNSVAVSLLVRLAAILDRDDLRKKAGQAIRALAGSVRKAPLAFDRLLAAADLYHSPLTEIVIAGPLGAPDTQALIRTACQGYDPYRLVLLADSTAPSMAILSEQVGPLQGKSVVQGRPAAYVCRQGTCSRPASSTQELQRELSMK